MCMYVYTYIYIYTITYIIYIYIYIRKIIYYINVYVYVYRHVYTYTNGTDIYHVSMLMTIPSAMVEPFSGGAQIHLPLAQLNGRWPVAGQKLLRQNGVKKWLSWPFLGEMEDLVDLDVDLDE